MRNVAKVVGQHGWTTVPVSGPDDGPSWVYTVGFDETLRHPELIIFDTPYEAAAMELHTAFEGLRSGELKLEDGMVWAEDQSGRCIVRKVHADRISGEGWFSLALHRRRTLKGDWNGLEAFQLVLADRAGVLPWKAGYDEAARRYQPALYLPPSEDPASAAIHDRFA